MNNALELSPPRLLATATPADPRSHTQTFAAAAQQWLALVGVMLPLKPGASGVGAVTLSDLRWGRERVRLGTTLSTRAKSCSSSFTMSSGVPRGSSVPMQLSSARTLAATQVFRGRSTARRVRSQPMVSAKSELAGAIKYALVRWTALTRYRDDGRVEIDNNSAERSIRPLVLGRRNCLFAGSDSGGERAANIYSLIGTALLNSRNPYLYLRHVLERIAEHPINRVKELLPWHVELEMPAERLRA
jgi:hypothetical protein